MRIARLVFQDCATCKWGLSMAQIKSAAVKLGFDTVEEMPFYAEGAAKIIKDADKKGVTVPFFECDGKYADSLGQLAEKLGISGKEKKGKVDGASTKAK